MIEDYYNDKLVGNFAQELYVTYSSYNLYWVIIIHHQTVNFRQRHDG